MTTNQLLGVLLALTGVADLVFARMLVDRLPPAARKAMSFFGVVFLVLGGALLSGLLRAV
jgi:hypothetical protein